MASSNHHLADSHDLIRVQGARENNLKDVSVEIPKRPLTVFTGLSESGKASLVFGAHADWIIDLGPGQCRHEPLHERAVGLVDQPLRLRGDRAEHQRALARSGDAGEDGQPAFGDLDADVLQVVHARAVHADEVVAVGCVRQLTSWMRIRLPAGSRTEKSRTPHGCSVGSWTTSPALPA